MGVFASASMALLLTIVVEAAAGWLFGLRAWRSQGILLLVNVLTNPLMNLALNALAYSGIYRAGSPFDPLADALELAVAAAEAVVLKAALKLGTGRAIFLSACANAASWLAGAVIFWGK